METAGLAGDSPVTGQFRVTAAHGLPSFPSQAAGAFATGAGSRVAQHRDASSEVDRPFRSGTGLCGPGLGGCGDCGMKSHFKTAYRKQAPPESPGQSTSRAFIVKLPCGCGRSVHTSI